MIKIVLCVHRFKLDIPARQQGPRGLNTDKTAEILRVISPIMPPERLPSWINLPSNDSSKDMLERVDVSMLNL